MRTLQVTHNGKPVQRLNELEVVKGYILANVWFSNSIMKIDPATGEVVSVLDFARIYPAALRKKELHLEDAVLNGIAYDARRDVLYITGKLWPRMYQVKLLDD